MKNTNELQRKEYISGLSYCNFQYLRKRQISKSNEQWECGKRIVLLCFQIISSLSCVFIPFFSFLCLSYKTVVLSPDGNKASHSSFLTSTPPQLDEELKLNLQLEIRAV